jgi:hypothetical protein
MWEQYKINIVTLYGFIIFSLCLIPIVAGFVAFLHAFIVYHTMISLIVGLLFLPLLILQISILIAEVRRLRVFNNGYKTRLLSNDGMDIDEVERTFISEYVMRKRSLSSPFLDSLMGYHYLQSNENEKEMTHLFYTNGGKKIFIIISKEMGQQREKIYKLISELFD